MAGLIPDSPLTNCVESKKGFKKFMQQGMFGYFKRSVDEILHDAIETSKPSAPWAFGLAKWSKAEVDEFALRLWSLVEGSTKSVQFLGDALLEHLLSSDYEHHGLIIILQIYLRLLQHHDFRKLHGRKMIYDKIILGKLQGPIPDESDLQVWESRYTDEAGKLKVAKYKLLHQQSQIAGFIYGSLSVLDTHFPSDLNPHFQGYSTLHYDPELPVTKVGFKIICNIFAGIRKTIRWVIKSATNSGDGEKPVLNLSEYYLRSLYIKAENFLFLLKKYAEPTKANVAKEEYEEYWGIFKENLEIPSTAQLPMTLGGFKNWFSLLSGEILKTDAEKKAALAGALTEQIGKLNLQDMGQGPSSSSSNSGLGLLGFAGSLEFIAPNTNLASKLTGGAQGPSKF